jgi:hypothetical protein
MLSEAHGRAVVLSPRDWALVRGWHEQGVPLNLVLETFEELVRARRRRRAAPPRDLAAIAAAVAEAWSVVRVGRRGEPVAAQSEADLPPLSEALARLRELARCAEPAGLGALVSDALERIDAGEEAAAIDRRIDRGLGEAAGAERTAEALRRVDERLAGQRARMEPSALATTRERALADALRAEFRLPRLGWRDPTR